MFVAFFRVGIMKFHHCWPSQENAFGHHLEKSTIATLPGKKYFRRPCCFLCRSGLLKFFAHVLPSIKRIVLRHLIHAGVLIQLYE